MKSHKFLVWLSSAVLAAFLFYLWQSTESDQKHSKAPLAKTDRTLGDKSTSQLHPPEDSAKRRNTTVDAEDHSEPDQKSGAVRTDSFHITGDRLLVGDLLVKDLPLDLEFEDAVAACMAIKQMEADLVKRILEEEPWLADVGMTYDEAVFSTEQGGLIVIGHNPRDPNIAVYLECPATRVSELMELQLAFLLITSGEKYRSTIHGISLSEVQASNPHDVYRVIEDSRGTGFSVVNGSGETVVYSQNAVPGMVF